MDCVELTESSEHPGRPNPSKFRTPGALINRAVNEERDTRTLSRIETHTDVLLCVHFLSWGGEALGQCYHRPDPAAHVGDDLAEVAGGIFDLEPAQKLAPQALRRLIGSELV